VNATANYRYPSLTRRGAPGEHAVLNAISDANIELGKLLEMRMPNDKRYGTYQLHDLELAIVGSEEGVEAPVLHVLGDDHDRSGLRNHALQTENLITGLTMPNVSN
jgi:hypothetical protein